ncbi:MAG: hypothetical protein NTW28_32530 [Candidatus Solibacter sp.]|nr:hypothetical protein [Candidatus Solibacter sp.]
MSGFIELGGVMFAARRGLPIPSVIAFGLTYQLGALFQNPMELTGRQYRGMVAVAAAAACASFWDFRLLWISLLLLGAGLQGLREEAVRRAPVGTLQKRIARIAGFSVAGWLNPALVIASSLSIILIAAVLRRWPNQADQTTRPVRRPNLSLFACVMVLHQMHYFAYCYALPILFLRVHGLNPVSAALAFAIGWISYSFAPSVLARVPTLTVVVAGHVGVSAMLLFAASNLHNLPMLLAAWFASGFGGGTVFGIRRLAVEWRTGDTKATLDMWENVGHVLGVLLAICLTLVASRVDILFLAAAGLASAVASILAVAGYFRWGRFWG